MSITMSRYQHIAQLWNWLPAFRGVAEFRSVQRAASELHISPSALSRTVRLLEEAIGEDLFVRTPSGLDLTTRGAALLVATRDAMRLIDDALVGQRSSTSTTIGATSELATHVVGASMLDANAARIRVIVDDDAEAALLRGDVDSVVSETTPSSSDVIAESIGIARHGVYVSLAHSHAGGTHEWTRDEFVSHAPTSILLLWCQQGRAAVVLPDPIARVHGLQRVADTSTTTELYLWRRKPLRATVSVDDALLTALRTAFLP
jgi:DNA-binding transcriptional LysR family regulator